MREPFLLASWSCSEYLTLSWPPTEDNQKLWFVLSLLSFCFLNEMQINSRVMLTAALLVLGGCVIYAVFVLGLPPLPSLPPQNLPGIAPLPMPSEFLPSFPLVPEVSSTAGSTELLSSLPPTGSPPSDPVPTTARADAASTLTVGVTPPTPKAPATVEDRVGESIPASKKPVSAVTDANASESP